MDASGKLNQYNVYVPQGTEFLERKIANSFQEAADTGAAWVKFKKPRNKEADIYRVISQPSGMNDGRDVLMAGASLSGKADLAINARSNTRRAAGAALLDYYMQANPELVEKEIVAQAKDKYSRINQLMGKETHHMLEIDSTNALLDALDPSERMMAVKRMLTDGFVIGDVANNQVALFGTSNPGPLGSASTNKLGINEHQGGVHSDDGFIRLASQYGFPNPRNSIEPELDTSVPRFAKDESTKAMVRDLRQMDISGPRTIRGYMNNLDSQEKRMAAVDMFKNLSRMSVQQARGIGRQDDGNFDKNNSAIARSLNNLDQSYRTIAGDDVANFENAFMANLGIDMRDEILGNRRLRK